MDDDGQETVAGLAAEVVGLLRARGETLATAESLTGGLVSGSLTSVPGASVVYVGGLVTYATRLKTELLGVPEELLAEHGVVSRACARAMSGGAAERTGADWGLATTGVAGPDPLEGRPAGTVHLAVRRPDGIFVDGHHAFTGARGEVRSASVAEALRLLRRVLLSANTGDQHPG